LPGRTASLFHVSSASRGRVAIFLSILILFFGVAIFSPLHKHTLGKTNSCSFNHLEHQMVSLAEAAIVLAPVAFHLEASAGFDADSPVATLLIAARDRAPPAIS